ncbi:hypothetical protein CCHR01_05834 [Colletotrichum chrysophilum]|uniref:Uncharacterized protein n=1 Tax=Colletotrichum chrysophilum TaxID=1836956 RepID=A0AAD9AP86_9PEZI|nr:hypothetical protein CCHR01_05834 [Colletotrichum chrysophilum]
MLESRARRARWTVAQAVQAAALSRPGYGSLETPLAVQKLRASDTDSEEGPGDDHRHLQTGGNRVNFRCGSAGDQLHHKFGMAFMPGRASPGLQIRLEFVQTVSEPGNAS